MKNEKSVTGTCKNKFPQKIGGSQEDSSGEKSDGGIQARILETADLTQNVNALAL